MNPIRACHGSRDTHASQGPREAGRSQLFSAVRRWTQYATLLSWRSLPHGRVEHSETLAASLQPLAIVPLSFFLVFLLAVSYVDAPAQPQIHRTVVSR